MGIDRIRTDVLQVLETQTRRPLRYDPRESRLDFTRAWEPVGVEPTSFAVTGRLRPPLRYGSRCDCTSVAIKPPAARRVSTS